MYHLLVPFAVIMFMMLLAYVLGHVHTCLVTTSPQKVAEDMEIVDNIKEVAAENGQACQAAAHSCRV